MERRSQNTGIETRISTKTALGQLGEKAECPAKARLESALNNYFKFSSFRPGQLESLLPLLHGRDVFTRMATGSGKSMCMFLAPLATSDLAVGVVISPLNALMEQQVKLLSDIGVSAIHVGAGSAFKEVIIGVFRFVFMSPETAVTLPWRNLFTNAEFQQKLCIIAVDEAHCIFEWGPDFRKCFDQIGGLRALTDVPIIALTATAPETIKNKICNSLGLSRPVVISQTLDRPNIYLSTSRTKGLNCDFMELVSLLKATRDPGSLPKSLVFCHTKEVAVKIYKHLIQFSRSKEYVSLFHASLTQATKVHIVAQFRLAHSSLRILVATIAFGMGMDIPDVDIVVVYGVPDTISQFYQLCGRAGRSGCPARAHLFSTDKKVSDNVLMEYSARKNTENCLRRILLSGLESTCVLRENTACCSVCCAGKVPYQKLDILKPAKKQCRKRPKPLREISEELRAALELELRRERDLVMAEKPHSDILGAQYLCCDAVIKDICGRADYIACVDDVMCIPLLRPELRLRFYNVVMRTVGSAPPANKQRRR